MTYYGEYHVTLIAKGRAITRNDIKSKHPVNRSLTIKFIMREK